MTFFGTQFTTPTARRNLIRGITLIESIVSVAILALAITGPLTLAAQSIRAAREARNELTATLLAEEALEVIHSIRDNKSGDDVNTGCPGATCRDNWLDLGANDIWTECRQDAGGRGCVIDLSSSSGGAPWPNNTIRTCSATCTTLPDDTRMYIQNTTRLYAQSRSGMPAARWSPTHFYRWVEVTSLGDPTPANPYRQIRVIANVRWRSSFGTMRTITISRDHFNWFPRLTFP